jgi:hypothetical protein
LDFNADFIAARKIKKRVAPTKRKPPSVVSGN